MVQGEGAEIVCLFGCGGDEDVLRCERLVAPDAEEGFVIFGAVKGGVGHEGVFLGTEGKDAVKGKVFGHVLVRLAGKEIPSAQICLQGIGQDGACVWFCVGELLVGEFKDPVLQHGRTDAMEIMIAMRYDKGLDAVAQLAEVAQKLGFP